MSARNKRYSLLILSLLIVGAAVILTCSDKIVNSGDTDVVEFEMPLKFADGQESLAEVVTVFKVTIIADNDTIVANLEYSNGSITGLIENVPAGPDRTIIVEGLAIDGTVIYRGSVVITVVADQTVDAEITLLAVAKLVRVSPNFVDGSYGNSFVSNVRVDNIGGLTAISLALDYNSNVIELDSVRAGADLPGGTNFSYNDEDGIEIELSHSSSVVNFSGNAILATAFFTPVLSNKCLDSSNLDLGIVALTAPGVTLSDIYVDDGQAHISSGRLVVSQDTLKFGLGVPGLNLDFKRVNISDSCGNEIAYVVSTEETWIDLNTAVAGITPGSIFIDVNPAGLPTGLYQGVVWVNSPRSINAPYEIYVTLEIDRGGRFLEVTPDSLTFVASENGPLPAIRQVSVEEIFGFNILFNVDEEIPWLNIGLSGSITPDSFLVGINTTALAPGTYIDSLYFSSAVAGNSPQYVFIRYALNAVPKFLDVIPDTLYFSAVENDDPPSSQTFRVFETGGYSINFNANEEASWLNLSGIGGTTPDTITVNISSTELEPGVYYSDITIFTDAADNSPRFVTIAYDLQRGPRILATEPISLHFNMQKGGVLPDPKTFLVFETGGHIINYSASEEASWFSISGVSGIAPETVIVSITSSELGPGMYLDSIEISSNEIDNSPIYVVISLGVMVGPKTIAVEPDSLHLEYLQYSGSFQFRSFRVFESNGYNISFSASESITWLSLLGVSAVTEDVIDVTYFGATELEPGINIDSIMISSSEAENSPIFLKVTLEIIYSPPPNLDVFPDTLYFTAVQNGPLPSSQDFIVHFDINVLPVPFDISESIPWLTVSKFDSVTTNWFLVEITSTALEPSVFLDSIMVSSEVAGNSPVFEYVVYTVTPPIDSIPPSAVGDLIAFDNTTTSVFLSWTASGDDSTEGTAAQTDIRYSTDLTDLLYWVEATQVDGEPAPQPSGSEENFEVTGLTPDYTYYFALDIIDDAGNHSGLSNVDSIYLPPFPPEIPVLISPADESVDISLNVTFVWHGSTGADNYELQYDTDSSFSKPFSYSEIADTTYSIESLSYETTYFWRVRAYNDGGYGDWSSVWSFTTISIPPTISGLVRDSDGEMLADVLIVAYDEFPNGTPLDSAFTDANGAFSFFDINGAVELYVFKEGYYPQTASVEAPDTSVTIFLIAPPAFTPSDKWVDLFCDSSYYFGNLIQPNDVVEAFDTDGVLCGRFVVHTEGAYGFMHVYRDEPETAKVDEGCETGDIITLKVNGEIAITEQPKVYPSSYQQIEACLSVTGEIPKWIVVLKPAGGETFYQDSSISVEWASTGISGLVEISLSLYDKALLLFDTTDNDGQHNLTIPIGINNSDDWRIQVSDLDEPVSDYSNLFTISSVGLFVEPTNLQLHGVLNDCVFDQKQFTISEVNGFNIAFEIIDTVSWLSVSPSSGITPAIVTVNILTNDLALGVYGRTLPIESNSAVNLPSSVAIELDNGQYVCGDFDNDCHLRVGDLSNMIDYLYRSGTPPLYPDALNADLCDGVDIADVDFLYTLIFDQTQSLCEGAAVCTEQSNDLGSPDSLGFVVAHTPSTLDVIPRLQLDLNLFNDANTINGLASGFGWDNANMILDSVRLAPVVEDSLSLNFVYQDDIIGTSNVNQRFLLAANRTIFSGISPAPASQLLASYYFTLSSWTSADSIVIDSLTFSQGTTYKMVSTEGAYRPVWRGPVIVKDQGF